MGNLNPYFLTSFSEERFKSTRNLNVAGTFWKSFLKINFDKTAFMKETSLYKLQYSLRYGFENP